MRLFVNLKREAAEYSVPPQRKIKHMKGPILCLFPSDVENAAVEACENQKIIAENFLANMIKENELVDEKFDRKNRIVEEVIDANLGTIINTITEEFHQKIRKHFSTQIYEQIKQSRRKIVDDNVESLNDLSTTLEAGNFAPIGILVTQNQKDKNLFLLSFLRQAKQQSRVRKKIQMMK